MSARTYKVGWDDGYSEGYACKLADATEPFAPVSAELPDRIQRAAELIQKRYAVLFADDRPAAIGLARSIAKLLTDGADGAPSETGEAGE